MSRSWFTMCVALPILACAGAPRPAGQTVIPRGPTSCSGLGNADTTVYDTTQVSEKPYARSGPVPSYPDSLRRLLVQGRVVVSAIIAADGTIEPSSIVIIKRDEPAFEAEALRWVRGALFWPGCRAGAPVRVKVAVPIDFKVRSQIMRVPLP